MDGLYIAILALVAVALNVPFGAYRVTTRRLSARWFLAVHLPIPFLLLLRVSAGYSYRIIPLLAVASVLGQLLGSWAYLRLRATQTPAAVAVPQDDPADSYPR
jgi:hypothetical protein